MLVIEDLHAEVNGKEILAGLDLTVPAGQVHAVMGPNGSGKSTLANVLAGRDTYRVAGGQVRYQNRDLLGLLPEERAAAGVFLAFQQPVEIPGVTNMYFLRSALNAVRRAHGLDVVGPGEFLALARDKMRLVGMDPALMNRAVNEGFSGGEKKRNEILQLAVLEPRLAILDETDSGLDIDALRVVADGVNSLRQPDRAALVITHHRRLLELLVPDRVHVLVGGRIVQSGGPELAAKLEQTGYRGMGDGGSLQAVAAAGAKR